MVEQAVEAVINGNPPGEFAFIQAGVSTTQIDVPLEKNLLDFLIEFYCTVFTPRLCDSDMISTSDCAQACLNFLQITIRELVALACRSIFPFSPFAPGTNTVFCSPEVWQVLNDHMTEMNINIMQNSYSAMSALPEVSDLSEVSDMSEVFIVDVEMENNEGMMIDTAVSRKCHKPDTPLMVSEV